MKCATRNVSARNWLSLILSLAISIPGAVCAAPSTAPADTPPASASPAPSPSLVPAMRPQVTYRLLSVEPDVQIEKPSRRRRVTARPRAILLKFERPTRLRELRGAIAVTPEVELDWNRSDQVEDSLVKLVGRFERNVKYELRVTGSIRSSDADMFVERGVFAFTLPASAPVVEFVHLGAVLERQSKQLVHLKMRDVEKVRLAVTEVPLASLLAPTTQLVDEPDDEAHAANGSLRSKGDRSVDKKRSRVPVVDAAGWSARAAALAPVFTAGDGTFAGLASGPVKTETDLFPEPGPQDKERRASLPLTWREAKSRGGSFVIEAQAVDPASSAVAKLVQITDLALSTKSSPGDLTVWVTRLSTGAPVAGAWVYLAAGSTRVWAAGRTDSDGILRVKAASACPSVVLNAPALKVEPAELALATIERVLAVTAEDSVWDLRFEDESVATPSSVKTGTADAPRAHAFTERGVYRPGDTVHFKVCARHTAGAVTVVPPPGTLCQVLIENPRGQLARSFKLPLSAFGTLHGSFALKAHEPLGQWSVQVRTPSEVKLATTEEPGDDPELSDEDRRAHGREARQALGAVWGETTFRMEEYVPPRHRVEVSFKEKTDGTERAITGVIAGVYYTGGPVKHGRVRWRVALTGTRESVPGAAGYTAGIDQSVETELLDAGEATLDSAGQLAIDVPLSAELADGRRAMSISATVLDFDTRAATGEGAWSSPPKFLVGIANEPATIRDREPVDLTAVVVERATGKPVRTGELTVAVLRRAHTHVSKRNEEGDFYDAAQPVMIRAFEWTTTLKDGVAPIHLEPSGAGEYALEVGYRAPDGTTYHSSRSFKMSWDYDYEGGDYCYEGSDHMGARWYSDRLHAVALVSDRGEYAPGETARLWLRAPRPPAAVLLAIEREHGLSVRRVKPSADGAIEVKIPEGWSPNVYVSVLVSYGREGYPVYPTDADTLAPSYGHGYLSLPIRKERTRLSVGLKGAGEGVFVLPGAEHSVTVTVADAAGQPVEAEVALAAVDEAVLSLTGYATPTLDQLFAISVPLGVVTHDTRRGVSLQTPYRALTVRPLTGGDGGEGRQSKTRENFNPVACWQPALVTDARGQATARFTLPDSMTSYRVFAVATTKGERHGSVARQLVVKKPFYLEAGLPRFFTAGDRARVYVALFNESGKAGHATLKVTAQGGLVVKVPDAPVAVGASDRVRVPVEVEALKAVHARLELEASLGEARDRVVLTVPVRERHTLRTVAVDGIAGPDGTPLNLNLPAPMKALSPEQAYSGKVELTLSSLPALRLVGGLDYLLQYPHGCIEQTASRILPLVSMRKMAAEGLVPGLAPEKTDPYIRAGVARLLSMQTEGGGFGYWPGDAEPHPWGSAYATMTLALARDGGAEVPAEALKRATKYLGEVLGQKSAGTAHALPFAHYALAVAGSPAGSPEQLAPLAGRFSHEERLFLWMAAARAGLTTAASEGLVKLLAEMKGKTVSGWEPQSFWSWGRTRAVALLATAEIAPQLPEAGELSMDLFRSTGPAGYWNNTHETAWTLIALVRMMEGSGASSRVACAYTAPGAAGARLTLDAKTSQTVSLDPLAFLATPVVKVTRNGPGLLVYRLAATYPYEGPEQTTDAQIERTYRRLAGAGPIKVGDLVEVELVAKLPRAYDYAALCDPLPAGLVAVNSALKSEPQAIRQEPEYGSYEFGDYISTWRPAYLEIRDDRVVAFRNYGWSGRYRFSYVARAVCEGTFRVPPAKVEPMYQPEDAWFSRAAELTIQPVSK